jgi:hypothetical protein
LLLGASGARASAPADWRDEVAALLAARARAVVRGDRSAFTQTMRGASPAFVAGRLRWFDGVRALPLSTYTLTLDDDEYLDLALALRHRPAGDEVHVVVATERIGIQGFDPRPESEGVVYTVVRRGSRWSIVSDGALARLGIQSARYPWDFAPLERLERSRVMVMYHTDRDVASRILSQTLTAIEHTRRAWPPGFDDPVVVVIPGSSREVSRIFETTVDLGPFVAFASASVERPRGGYRLGGSRVYIQPDTFFDYSTAYQLDTLGHEMLHAASRSDAGAFTPSWLDEGVAQSYGERNPAALDVLPGLVRSGAFDGRLPESYEFFLGSRDDIHNSYQESMTFLTYLRDRFGADAGARFYRAVGRESPVSFGTARYHLDRASRATFGVGFDALERAWARAMRARYA